MSGSKPNTAEENRRKLIAAEKRQARVVSLYLQSARVHQIAKLMGISDRTVLRDIERARASWREVAGRVYDDLLPEKLAELDEIRRAAWKGWKRSLEDEEEITEETSAEGKKSKTRRRGQSGNPAYLNTLEKILRTECELRGMLDAKPAQEQVIPVVEVIVSNRDEKEQFETITTQQFKRISETPG